MAPTEEDTLMSGRQSRASNFSGQSRPHDLRSPVHAGDMLGAAAPAVMSMLRTTTDTGDLGSLSVNQGRTTHLNHQLHRKRFHPSRMSDGSSRSNQTSRIPKRHSNNTPWDGRSTGHRDSVSSLQTTRTMPAYYNENLGPPLHPPPMRSLPPNPSPAPSSLDGRSYSMTQSHAQQTLIGQRSAGSLRSQASTTRLHPHRLPYPPSSRRHPPGFRPISPAMSDYGVAANHGPGQYAQRSMMASYHNDFGYAHALATDLRPRYPQSTTHYPTRHVPRSMTPPAPSYGYDQIPYGYTPFPMRTHPQQAVMNAPLFRQGHAQHQQTQHRMFPPGLEATPPSSGPSSSAPPSSDPSTPQDCHQPNVIEIPEFAGPRMGESPDENSEQAIFSSYIAYATKTTTGASFDADSPPFGLEAEIERGGMTPDVPGSFPDDGESHSEQRGGKIEEPPESSSVVDVTVPSQPPTQPVSGLVQRIKHLLENKAEEPTSSSLPKTRAIRKESGPRIGSMSIVHDPQDHANDEPGQASTRAAPIPEAKITRELIKAMTSPSLTKLDTMISDEFAPKRVGGSDARETAGSIASASSNCPSEVQEKGGEDKAAENPLMKRIFQSADDGQAGTSSPLRDTLLDPELSADPYSAAKSKGREQGVVVIERSQALASGEEKTSPAVTSHEFPTCESDASPGSRMLAKRRSGRLSQAESDLDEIADAHAGVTSDIVTDIAVRFSIPRHTSMAKANIVRVSSLPEHPHPPLQLHEDIHELPSTVSPRGSVYDMETVSPLQVAKLQKSADDIASPGQGADLSNFIRRSFPRRHSTLLYDKPDLSSFGSDTQAEVRTALQPVLPSRLPNVKEESQEDIADPRPRAVGASIASIAESTLEEAARTRAHLSLSEIRNLPSLNFSQVNLIDQLNAALDDRTSFEALRKRNSSSIVSPSPLRPSSTEALRERYTSFFAKPEDFHVPTPDDSESFSVETLMASRKDEQQRRLILSRDQDKFDEKISVTSKNERIRSLSPSELLGVASDAERLTIPSVSGLSNRLSELLPSLKRLHLDSTIADDEAVEHTIDEIHHLGQRPITMLSARSSGVLRSLAAIADDFATNGTHTSTIVPAAPRYNKSLPPLPAAHNDGNIDDSGLTVTARNTGSTTETATSHDSVRPGVRRTRSENRGSTAALLRPDIPSASQTRRSLTISSPNSRPWNFDENYPWSADTGLLSIDFQLQEKGRESITSHLLRDTASTPTKHDRTMMSATTPSVDQLAAESTSLFDAEEFDPTATVTADTLTAQHTRKLSKKAASLFGSLSRRAKLPSPLRLSTDSIRSARRPGTAATVLSGKTVASRPHAVGDRYPCTALQAPLGYDVDEVRSYFSDEGESRASSALGMRQRETRANTLKKRLSGIRFRPEIRIRPASDGTERDGHDGAGGANRHSVTGFSVLSPAGDAGMTATRTAGPATTHYGVEGGTGHVVPGGMGRVEFQMKRLGKRVRMCFVRGGELLRRVSGRARRERLRQEQEWLEESGSVYSGT
ncbi:hypothetical protein ANO11243_011820 [Dothideomycetidae sp. 11243]|nr:hypothetical protein ANO11243_011820 [fungal sp. No.11243]